ncbi:MAG: hypoxanthine phosphoribosyltransferase [Candidatus Muiribacteriota bacterium]
MKTLISREQIEKRVKELAFNIENDYQDEKIIFVCILKGAFMFVSDLVKNISKTNINIEFMVVSSYENFTKSTGKIKIIKDVDKDISDQNIIIVEDIVDTGYTLDFLYKYFKNKGAKSIKVCTFLNKKVCRKIEVPVHYFGFEVGDEFVIGYGLDYCQEYRNLPYIGVWDEGSKSNE